MSLKQNFGGVGALAPGFEAHLGQSQYDLDTLLAIAHSIGNETVGRLASGHPDARDLPVTAVAIDLDSGEIYPARAQDHELDDRTAHAERMAVREAAKDGVKPHRLGLIIGLEPCDDCLDFLGQEGVPYATFVLPRDSVAGMGLIKPHPLSALELAARGRAEGRHYPELTQITDPAWRGAFLALFKAVHRDPVGETVAYKPSPYL